jgi:hypothetical protein
MNTIIFYVYVICIKACPGPLPNFTTETRHSQSKAESADLRLLVRTVLYESVLVLHNEPKNLTKLFTQKNNKQPLSYSNPVCSRLLSATILVSLYPREVRATRLLGVGRFN